ncbi:MAG: carboxylating nicotinate-nucleotide diphosphorylase [Bacteroidia bacterium]|nr:carboxylating nicotinate-nucleotide diphosphorylase [Bacteroidia bacterium]|tara:strand:- start:2089 stop:2934 length:846 start_codon:yes stop_codon:yes gene_type:complete
MNFTDPQVSQLIELAIAEDIGDGDHSSLGAIASNEKGKARLLVKDAGVLCGIHLAKHIFHRLDSTLVFEPYLEEGSRVKVGDIAFSVRGSIHSILQAERLVLNFMQRMSGISTLTKRLVDIIEGTGAQLLDTRKTTPGMRVFEKYAVSIGGGVNHRMGLFDMVMLKDNHNDYAGGITAAVNQTKAYLTNEGKSLKIEVETRNLEEVKEAIAVGVNRIMFDNFTPEEMKKAVSLVGNRCETEASGGITENTIRSYAETGVNFISVGALTHSVKSLDLSLKQY